MNYLSASWNVIMELYRKVLESPRLKNNPLLCSDIEREYTDATKNLKIGEEVLRGFFKFLSTSIEYLPESFDQRDLNPAEREAANGNILGTNTAEGRRAVAEGEKRLAEQVARIPLDEPEKELQEKEVGLEGKRAAAEKEVIDQRKRVERMRVEYGRK